MVFVQIKPINWLTADKTRLAVLSCVPSLLDAASYLYDIVFISYTEGKFVFCKFK